MKLIAALVLFSVAAFAQDKTSIKAEDTRDKGKLFNKIVSSTELELRKNLEKLYEKYHLDKSKDYFLINLNKHPGLMCHTLVSGNGADLEIEYTNETTLFVPAIEKLETFNTYSKCLAVTYISNADQDTTMKDAIDQTITSILVSSTEIISRSHVKYVGMSAKKVLKIEEIQKEVKKEE